MTNASDLRSGKTHRDENFPVASHIIHPRHRSLILAFYDFVRTADDIADHAELNDADKLRLLNELDSDLIGSGDGQPDALRLRDAFAERGMGPRHARDVITAFRMDIEKRRYDSWDELIHYCSFSAMPVGRFMLEVHGEDQSTWAASDAMCAALQINNHLQDCGDDYRELDRVYFPQELLTRKGARIEDLGAAKMTPALLACVRELADRTEGLMRESASLTPAIKDARLGYEVAIIENYAWKILGLLKDRDPLAERVHLTKAELIGYAVTGLVNGWWRRTTRSGSAPKAASRS